MEAVGTVEPDVVGIGVREELSAGLRVIGIIGGKGGRKKEEESP